MTPTGVEHYGSTKNGSLKGSVFFSMTPTGVEHTTKPAAFASAANVFFSMTPTGVEHAKVDAVLDPNLCCVFLDDADRR